MMAIPAKMTAQDVVVTDLPLLHEMIDGREVRARYIFLENFADGDKGTELFDKADQIAREYVFKKPLSYDPQKILDEFRKYAIGRRSWLDVIILENGRYAVRTSKGWGVMGIDGSFTMPDRAENPLSCFRTFTASLISAMSCCERGVFVMEKTGSE